MIKQYEPLTWRQEAKQRMEREVSYEQSRYITLYRLGWRRNRLGRPYNPNWPEEVRIGWQARQDAVVNPYTITLVSAEVASVDEQVAA